MINDTLLNSIATNDRLPLIRAMATHMTASDEMLFYFAVKCFYASPSLQKVPVMQAAFIGNNATIQLNISNNDINTFTTDYANWQTTNANLNPGTVSPSRRIQQTLNRITTTLFDNIWNGVNANQASWRTDLINHAGNNPPTSSAVALGPTPNYQITVNGVINTLANAGIVI